MMIEIETPHRSAVFGHVLRTVILIALAGCSSSPDAGRVSQRVSHDGRYDSSFPQSDTAPVIERVVQSVQMITAITFYKVFSIPEGDSLEPLELIPGALERYATGARFVNTTQVGASMVLSITPEEALVLTCAHVVVFPDTILAYHYTTSGSRAQLLSSVAIRERTSASVAVLPEGGTVDVLASDGDLDIAILGKRYTHTPGLSLRVFPYPFGTAAELDWGTFVYVLGYPRGHLMLTHGLVSLSRRTGSNGFLIDAGMGRGFSGGPVLAIRDGVPNVECVGMARMMPGTTSYVLSPEPDDGEVDYDPAMPYHGDIFVRRQTEPHYGMAWAIGAEAIVAFLEQNRPTLVAAGYTPPSLSAPDESHD